MAEEGADQWIAEGTTEQPREESSSPRKSPSPPDHEEKTTHVRFLLSNAEAGSVIGKGGSTINDFQAQSGARIQLSRNFEYFPGTSDRIVMVSGTIDDVLRAVELIMTKLLDEFHAEEEGDVDPRLRLRLIVPNGSCGGLIGKGGSIIKSLIEDSQAGIKISPLENSFPGLYDRLVTVDGNLGEQMRAIELMLLKLADDSQYTHSVVGPFPYAGRVPPYNGMHYGPGGGRGKAMNGRIQTKEEGSNSVTIGVPDEQIGLVVGRGGRNLVEISQISGAKIRISDRGDFLTGTSNRKVTITGSQRSIRVAETMISGKVSSVAAKG